MVTISNGNWKVQWNEQSNEMLIWPQWAGSEYSSMLITGRRARELSQLIQSAIELPSGQNP